MGITTIYILLNLLSVVNILLLVTFLSIRKNNTLPNYLLAFILSIPGLYLIDNILICSKYAEYFSYFFFVVQILANLFPIAVYYYIHLLLGDNKKFQPILISGTIILLIYSTGLLIYYLLMDAPCKLEYLKSLTSNTKYPISMDIYNIAFYMWQMIYLIVLFIQTTKYQKTVKQNLSDISSVKLVFIKQFVSLLMILDISLVILYSVIPMTIVDYGILPIIVSIIYSFIIFFSIKNNAILNPDSYNKLNKINYQLIFGKNDNIEENFIREEKLLKHIETNIINNFENQKIYRNPDITLSTLSELINEKPYLISKTLNKKFNKNFYEIINEYRINDAILLLKNFDAKQDKIDNIAFEVGFNSRATFYRAFKKITGKSPSEFVSTTQITDN